MKNSKRRSKSPTNKKKVTQSIELSKPPEDWTKAELMDKINVFGTLVLDKVSGSGKLDIANKNILDDELAVIMEILRRYSEVQHITLRKCFLTDEILLKLEPGLNNLRHLKTLNLSFNALTSASVGKILSIFSKKQRKILNLDLRENVINDIDGTNMYKNMPGLDFLNGFDIKSIKASSSNVIKSDIRRDILDLSGKGIKLSEVAILCCILLDFLHITEVDVSKNHIDCYGLKNLVNCLYKCPYVRKINLSSNPVTNNSKDISGIEALTHFCRNKTSMNEIILDNIVGIPKDLYMKIDRSCSVNRTLYLKTQNEHTFFQLYIYDKLVKDAPILPTDPLENWNPSDKVDKSFCIANKLDTITVEPTVHLKYKEESSKQDKKEESVEKIVIDSTHGIKLKRVGSGPDSFLRKF